MKLLRKSTILSKQEIGQQAGCKTLDLYSEDARSVPGGGTCYPEALRGFHQSLQANASIIHGLC
jgi:hypothetical protein